MMRPSRHALSPVVTILSPSPTASRKAQEILGSIVGLEEVVSENYGDDTNDALNASSSLTWDSIASRCPNSGALIHWLALENSNREGSFSLLGVSDSGTASTTSDVATKSIEESRALLASNFPSSSLSLKLRNFLRRPMTVDALLKRHQGLPVLDLPASFSESVIVHEDDDDDNNKATETNRGKTRLKEIGFTMYDDATYEDGSTVLSRLGRSSLSRPVTGLYEWPPTTTNKSLEGGGGIWLRPIPAAKQDLKGGRPPPLVLTFHCDSIERVLQEYSGSSSSSSSSAGPVEYSLSKIGFTGQGPGQVRIEATGGAGGNNNNNPLNGLDVRWCERIRPTSAFVEAQESLLASSLPELQSVNVLKSTGKNEPGKDDSKIGSSDCWVEVRTMVQNPGGFVPSSSTTRKGSSSNRVATAPPSYPE